MIDLFVFEKNSNIYTFDCGCGFYKQRSNVLASFKETRFTLDVVRFLPYFFKSCIVVHYLGIYIYINFVVTIESIPNNVIKLL